MSSRRIALKLTTLTGVGVAGWYAGKYHASREEKVNSDEKLNVMRMPGLPIFGTVSAILPTVQADSSLQTQQDMGSKLSTTAPRITEVRQFHICTFSPNSAI